MRGGGDGDGNDMRVVTGDWTKVDGRRSMTVRLARRWRIEREGETKCGKSDGERASSIR